MAQKAITETAISEISNWDSVSKFTGLRLVAVQFFDEQNDSFFAYEDKNLEYFRQFSKHLDNPNPFSTEPRDNGAVRDSIRLGTVQQLEKYRSMKLLSEQDKYEILAIADIFNMHEYEGLDCWLIVAQQHIRRRLEVETNSALNSLECSVTAAQVFLELEKDSLLETVELLFSHRHNFNLSSSKHNVTMKLTNELLRNNIVTHIIDAIRIGLEQESNFCRNKGFMDKYTRRLADTLFLVCHRTQITAAESKTLAALINYLSRKLSHENGSSSNSVEDVSLSSHFYVLMSLQLTQVATLGQTAPLFSRDLIEPPFFPDYDVDIYNTLTISPDEASVEPWCVREGSKCVHGLAYLALAVLRQPYVENEEVPSYDVIGFIQNACNLRSFSYLRLCVVPSLQCGGVGSMDSRHLYSDVIFQLLENLLKIFPMSVYEGGMTPDGKPFFLPDGDQKGHGKNLLPGVLNDTLVDFLDLLRDFCRYRPDFCEIFFETKREEMADLTDDARTRGLSSPFLRLKDAPGSSMTAVPHHPFLEVVLKICTCSQMNDVSCLIPSWRFLASLACNAPMGEILFHFIERSENNRRAYMLNLGWRYFFNLIQDFVPKGQSNSQKLAIRPLGHEVEMVPKYIDDIGANIRDIDPTGMSTLTGILELFCSVMESSPSIVRCILDSYKMVANPISTLFSLFSCSLPMQVKGLLLRTLAAFVVDREAAVDTWALLEAYRLFPCKSLSVNHSVATGSAAGSTSSTLPLPTSMHRKGLREELEGVECKAGKYPITDGFLQLLETLLRHGIPPESIGKEYRVPGILLYLEYVIEDLLLKADDRLYTPEGTAGRGQQWKITAKCFKILSSILQLYPVNKYSLSEVLSYNLSVVSSFSRIGNYPNDSSDLSCLAADFREDTIDCSSSFDRDNTLAIGSNASSVTVNQLRIPRPKSPGFVILGLILNKSRLLGRICNSLRDCSVDNITDARRERIVEVAVESIGILRASIFRPLLNLRGGYGLSQSTDYDSSYESEVDLSDYRISPTASDCSFWMHQTATAVVGLLFEVSLRDRPFGALISSNPVPLTMVRLEHGRPLSSSPIVVQSLADILANTMSLSSILQYINISPSFLHTTMCFESSNPSLAVMALRIIEFVAVHTPPDRVRSALTNTLDQRRSSSSSSSINNFSLSHQGRHQLPLDHEQRILRSCVDAIRGDILFESFMEINDMYPLGVEHRIKLYGADNVVITDANPNYYHAASLRGAMLTFLLKTLSCDSLCISHHLLGLTRKWKGPTNSGSRSGSSLTIYEPVDCLDAILSLIFPVQGLGPSILATATHTSDFQDAQLCYELLYRLVSSPLTSEITLGRLKEVQYNFLPSQLQSFKSLLFQIATSNSSRTECEELERRTAIRHCLAWLLEIAAVEVLQTEKLGVFSSNRYEDILSPLFMADVENEAGKTQSVSHIGLMLFLKFAEEEAMLAPRAVRSFNTSKLQEKSYMRTLLDQCVVPLLANSTNSADKSSSRLRLFDLSLFKEITTKYLNGSLTSSLHVNVGTESGFRLASRFSQTDFSDAHSFALESNLTTIHINSCLHLTKAWRQALSVLLVKKKCQDILMSFHNIDLIVKDVAMPTLEILSRISRIPIIAEQVASASMLILDIFCKKLQVLRIEHVNESSKIGYSAERHAQLLSSLLQTIITSHRDGTDPAIVKPSHFNSSILSEDSYRENLYISLSNLLKLPSSNSVVSEFANGGQNSSISTEIKWLGDNQRKLLSDINLEILERFSVDIVDTLGRDCTFGLVGLRSSALSALSLVFMTLGPCRDNASNAFPQLYMSPGAPEETRSPRRFQGMLGSHMFSVSIQLLNSRGYLSGLLGNLRSLSGFNRSTRLRMPTNSETSPLNQPHISQKDAEMLLEGTVTLCTHIACSQEGIDALLMGDLWRQIHGLTYFHKAPPSVDDSNTSIGADVDRLLRGIEDSLRKLLLPLLRLMCTLASASPSIAVLEGCAQFLRDNHQTISYFLRLQLPTTLGLLLTDHVVCLFKLIASAAPQASSQSNQLPLWDLTLQHHSESFVVDICSLIKVAGQRPSPIKLSGVGKDAILLNISSHIASFLRLRCESFASSKYGDSKSNSIHVALRQGLANIDLSTVFDFFCSNAAVAIKQSHNILNGLANTKVDNNCNHGGDNSEQFVAIHICENLICVLLDLVVAATPSEIAAWSNALDKCVSEAEKFPAHSFIGHVLRWLKEKRKGF